MGYTIFILALIAFTVADCVLYAKSKWPERARRWWCYLPGSGFLSYLKFGPNR